MPTDGDWEFSAGGNNAILTKFNGTNVSNLVVPSTVSYQGKTYTVTSIQGTSTSNPAVNNSSLATGCTLTLPSTLRGIGAYAFYGCSNFTGSLVIPDSVTTILNYAFNGCSGFTSLVIPDSVTGIGNAVFTSCTGFTGSLTIPDSVRSIGSSAFQNCTGFTGSLTIGNSVTTIGNQAFYYCTGFTGSLIIPDSVRSIGSYAFQNCTGFTGTLTIPNSVTTILNYAFRNCSGFTGSLVIPDSVTTIGSYAFYNCSGFTGSLTIPNTVTSIGNNAFRGCSGFNGSLIIPNSITSIAYNTFYGCTGFTGSLVIPDSVTNIERYAFQNCAGFISVVLPDTLSSIGTDAFLNCTNLVTIYNASSLSLTIGSTSNGYVAYYANIIYKCYTVTIQPNSVSYGSISKSKVIARENTSLTINGTTISTDVPAQTTTATPSEGCSFTEWTNATGTIVADRVVIAVFYLEIAKVNVKINGMWTEGGVYVKVNGEWVNSKRIYTKVDGEWLKSGGDGPAKFWAVDIAKSTSDPTARCTYPQTITVNGRTRNNECYGYTPMSGSSSGTFNHGSWDDSELLNGIKPVSKDGTTWTDQVTNASSWSNNTSGSSDYFTEFPFHWLSITNDNSKVRIIFSNADFQPDDTFQCYAHAKGCDSYSNTQVEEAVANVSRADILEKNDNLYFADSFHIGCFLANGNSSGIYSKKGSTLLVSTPYATYWQGANARGTDYDCISFQQLTYLQALFVLLFKSTNSQGTHSSGYSGGNAVPSTQTGLSTDKYGMSGKISGNTTRMSFFWIHDLWGSVNQYIGGLWERGDGTFNMYYWLPRQANSRAFTNGWSASSTATSQASLGTSATTGSNSWHFISSVAGTNKGGFYPTAQSGATATTYFCDIGYTESSSANANFPTIGGFFNSDTYNGIFYVETNRASTFSHPSWAGRLAYRGGH